MEMGLGKTALELNEWLDTVEQLAVICPNSNKVDVWVSQVETWCPHVLKHVTVWPDEPTAKTNVFIMNYEGMLTPQGFEAMQKFIKRAPTYIVASESQKIKGHSSQRTGKALILRRDAEIRRIETGTPWVQNVMDVWAQLRFINQLHGTNPFAFRNRYAKKGGFMGKQIIGIQEDRRPELEAMLDSCSFRALKADWCDIPEKRYGKRGFEMKGKQLQMFREMRAEFATMLRGEEILAHMVITQMTKLQQISRGFILNEDKKALEIVPPDKNPAIGALEDILEETQKKLIVFCGFRYSCEMVWTYLKKIGLNPALIMGGVKDTMGQTRMFNDDSTSRVMVAQMSMATGFTWLGQPGKDRCSVTVFYEDTYNLEHRLQAEDRNHRNGQDEDVSVIDLTGSVQDRAIWEARVEKQSIAEAVVNSIRSMP